MSNSITRSPSLTLVHDSLADYHAHPAEAREVSADRIEQYLAADQDHVLERGRRLFDLVRAVPKPTQGTTHSAQVPQFPGDLPDRETYLSAARPLVAQIVQGVYAKSSQFQLARAALQRADIETIGSTIASAVLGQILGTMGPNSVDTARLNADLKAALADVFITEDALFRYARNLSPETLQALGSDTAILFRRGLRQMQETLQTKLPELLQKLMGFEEGTEVPPLTAEEQAKVARIQAWARDVNPNLLAQIDSIPAQDPVLGPYLKGQMLLVIYDVLSGFDLDALAAFHKSPAGKEIKAKEAALGFNKDDDLLTLQINNVLETHLQAAKAPSAGLTDAELLELVEGLGLPVPQTPEQRAAFFQQVKDLLQAQ